MKKHTMNFGLWAVLLALVFCGCDMPDVNVRDEIDAAVWEANAPAITVYPYALAGTGVITPSGVAVSGDSYRAKQHISFDVSYNLTNQNYTFLRWAAFEGDARLAIGNGIYGTGEYGANRVLIESDAERRTNARVTVRLDGGVVTLTPVVALRPRVVSFQPDGGIATPAILTTPIVIQFSTAINIASIIYGWDADGTPVWRNAEGVFKNITITGRGTFGSGPAAAFEKYYNDPVLDSSGTILTFTANKTAIEADKPYFSYVYVDLDGAIASQAAQEVTLGAQGHFQYYIENKWDTTGPVNTLLLASTDQYSLSPPATVQGEDNIYLIVAAYDSIDKVNLESMKITETFYTGSVPAVSDTPYTVTALSIDFVNRYDNSVYTALKGQVEDLYGSLPGVLYVIPYQLRDGSTAGKVEIVVVTTDQSDNPSLTWRVEGDAIVYSDRDMYSASRVVLIRE